nr:hypothetical protein [Burkholderia ubonensis]
MMLFTVLPMHFVEIDLAVERTSTDAGVALGIEPDVMRFEYDKGG